jgi:uncharacterized membrane protein YgdD (TMEM256/DUF423 family)
MVRLFLTVGGAFAFLGVAAGAFGAHALENRISVEMLSAFEVGVRYQMYHAFALIVTAWLQSQWPSMISIISGWLFILGVILFSGSLYLLSLVGLAWVGPITPLGGLAFLFGWLLMVLAAFKV